MSPTRLIRSVWAAEPSIVPTSVAMRAADRKTVSQWFNTGAFAAPVAPWNGGTNQGFGTAGKDAVVGPGLFNWNLALFKSFPFTGKENPHLELRVETFNTFNHTEFNGVDTGFTDGNFGQVTSTFDPREFQFGGKIVF